MKRIFKGSANKMIPSHDFRIILRQEPDRGRMCGLGDSVSRRMLDPPLVLQVIFTNKQLSKDQLYTRSMQLLCSVHLMESMVPEQDDTDDTDQISCATLVQSSIKTAAAKAHHDKSCIPVLLGTTCINATILNDLDGTPAMFFVFHDLAVRLQGHFQLSWTVLDMYPHHETVDLNNRDLVPQMYPSNSPRPVDKALITQTDITRKFTCYPPQKYPGAVGKFASLTVETSALSRCFYVQGLPIRSGSQTKRYYPLEADDPDADQKS